MAQYPKSCFPATKLAEFLVQRPAEIVCGGIVSQEDFDRRRARNVPRRPDGTERPQFKDMETGDKLEYLYNSGQQTQRELLQNSIRLYGVKKNDAKGVNPTEVSYILRRICDEGLKLTKVDTELITTSGLRSIQRVESGKCIVFQLNRVDLIRKIFEKVGNLKDYENPYNKNMKIVFTRNLCPDDNRIRSECLTVKELLKDHGFRDIKIRFNKLISVNGGPWHEYGWFLENRYEEANLREQLNAQRQGLQPPPQNNQGAGRPESYAAATKKRKNDQGNNVRAEGEDGDVSSNVSPTGSETQEPTTSGGDTRPKKQRKNKKPRQL